MRKLKCPFSEEERSAGDSILRANKSKFSIPRDSKSMPATANSTDIARGSNAGKKQYGTQT
jgi:hypothetical protein